MQGKGTAVHMMPLGDWFLFFCFIGVFFARLQQTWFRGRFSFLYGRKSFPLFCRSIGFCFLLRLCCLF